MKIHSNIRIIDALVLGSAAAFTYTSGAYAADAVMAPEPEPVEYVRICDAYGAGFFYIPGTETCLQISGFVRYQIATDTVTKGWNKAVAARVNFDARSETDWGTLRSYIRMNSEWNGVGDGRLFVEQSLIQLGGFTLGYTESFWDDAQDGGVSNYGSHSDAGLYYGYQRRALMGYTYNSNGFVAALSLEDDGLAGGGYMPDVVGKLAYHGAWGGVWAKGAYDESFDGFAGQLGAQFNIPNTAGSSLRVIGYWADGDHRYNVGAPGTGLGTGGAEWSVLASYKHQFNEKFGASIGGQYFNNLYLAGTNVSTNVDAWAAELSLVWTPITNFEVRTEITHRKTDIAGTDSTSGFLRFQRSF
jgi:hypothetical protein